jgi:protein dithiol:quinone oxidoreductase
MPLNTELPSRILTAIAFVSFAAVGAALLSQHLLGLLPCAWCIFQRLLFIVICVVATLGAALGGRVARRISLILVMLVSLVGIAAAWHQWTVASQSLSCDQTLADRLVVGSGLDAAMPWLFGIYANCMDAAVSILGLDFAVWSLVLYAAFAIGSVLALRSSKQA